MLREKSCGIVPFREVDGEIVYLVISSAVTKREHWEFPKGGVEEGERELDTALRELWEETGVKDVRVLPGYREPIRYIYRRPEGLVSKQVVYFIGKVGDPSVTLREVEAKDYRWADYEETRKLLRHANARALLERCHAFITGKPLPASARRDQQPGRPGPVRPRPERGDAAEAFDRRRRRRGGGQQGQKPASQGAGARPEQAAAAPRPAPTQSQTPERQPVEKQVPPAAPQPPIAPPEAPRPPTPARAEKSAATGERPPDKRRRRRRRRRGGREGKGQAGAPPSNSTSGKGQA